MAAGLILLSACHKEKYVEKEAVDANGYKYTYVTNDPQKVREYTLENGLKIILSENKDEPRIATRIAVRAGSTYDPGETTGLAHYFEHLMFKGTQHFGTTDWEKEKVILDEITGLFEAHKAEQDPDKKLALYKKIDEVSYEASKLAIPNEYDKMVSAMGATGTNAATSWEYTTYVNEIPSNELERWINMEYERFDSPVLRLFHTELETVYEEYNRGQDNDQRRQFQALLSGLFPGHPLGISVLGYPEHLKNPSIKNIYEFFNTWYVPNNMAFILSGDLDYEETVKLIDETWGKKESKTLPELDLPELSPVTEVVEKHVTGPDAESVLFAFRFGGTKSADNPYVTLIDYILANSTAGLMDINLNQKQEVLYSGCGTMFMNHYGFHYFIGAPKHGQTLEQVRDLMLAQIDSVKQGKFEDWMLEAAINNMELSEIRENESNSRVSELQDMFIAQESRSEVLSFYDQMRNITKEQLMDFAKTHYKSNYVIVYKYNGEAEGVTRMPKPPITPVVINRDAQSDFMQNFLSQESEPIQPVFVDYGKEITTEVMNDHVDLKYIHNKTNELFQLSYIVEMGKYHDIKLPLAVNLLPYLGTDKYSAEDLQKEFFKLGISMSVQTGADRSYLTINGLSSSMEKGIELFEHVLANAKADTMAYQKYVQSIYKNRMDAKLNPRSIQSALINYGKYGENSPQTYLLTMDEMAEINPEELTARIHEFASYPHRIFYYGPKAVQDVKTLVLQHHKLPSAFKTIPEQVTFEEQSTSNHDILYVDYDKSQVDVIFLAKKEPYDKDTYIQSQLFNEYYGSGMNSVIFQEIREARALAYTAFAYYGKPSRKEQSFYLNGAVFTQSDKMMTALATMDDLLNTMVENEKSFKLAQQNIIKTIQTERIIKGSIFWSWLNNQEYGIDYDVRKDLYDYAQTATLDDVSDFFSKHIEGSEFTYLISGKKTDLDMKAIQKKGKIKELTLEEIFGY